MAKRRALTEDFFVQQFSAFQQRFEERMDFKIDEATFSFKEYVGMRLKQSESLLREDLGGRMDKLDKKLDIRTAGIVKMIEELTGKTSDVKDVLGNHELRISRLEPKVA